MRWPWAAWTSLHTIGGPYAAVRVAEAIRRKTGTNPTDVKTVGCCPNEIVATIPAHGVVTWLADNPAAPAAITAAGYLLADAADAREKHQERGGGPWPRLAAAQATLTEFLRHVLNQRSPSDAASAQRQLVLSARLSACTAGGLVRGNEFARILVDAIKHELREPTRDPAFLNSWRDIRGHDT